jgi:hypothetical protein
MEPTNREMIEALLDIIDNLADYTGRSSRMTGEAYELQVAQDVEELVDSAHDIIGALQGKQVPSLAWIKANRLAYLAVKESRAALLAFREERDRTETAR